MNWSSFGIFGYLSVLASGGTLALLLLQMKKPSRRVGQAAIALAVAAFVLAKINSTTHVNRIAPDLSEQTARSLALQQAAEQKMLNEREKEVADVRFAEDQSGEHLDTAGLDGAELKRLEKLKQAATQPPTRQKRERGATATEDTSLEGMIGGGDQSKGVEVEVNGDDDRPPSAIMSEADLLRANRLDGWNLDLTRILIGLALVGLFCDYLRRANLYQQATLPLPFPASWRQSFNPLPPVFVRPEPPRRDLTGELSWLVRRGDVFLLLASDQKAAAALPASFSKGFVKRRPVDAIAADDEKFTDDFIFEALWFGRACFVIGSKERADRILRRFVCLLEERRKFRARVRANVHVVCELDAPPPGEIEEAFTRLAPSTGFSLFLSGASRP
ncbi:MAG: hypothetical protein ACKO2G_10950 [Verrucomicrobiales bacterium]